MSRHAGCRSGRLRDGGLFHATLLPFLLAMGFGAIVLGVALEPLHLARILASPLLRFFAKISYSLYLTHFALYPLLYLALLRLPGFVSLGWGTQFLLFLPLYLALSVGVALMLFYAVEKPFLHLRARVGRGPARRRVAAPATAAPAATPGRVPG